MVVTPGTVSRIFCDGINIIDEAYIPGQPGDIKYTARSTAPNGWLKANGDTVSRTTYAALFAAIGTTFGAGDGSTTFNLPDLRSEFIRGWDDGRGIDSGRALGSSQGQLIESHDHLMGEYKKINADVQKPITSGAELSSVGLGSVVRTNSTGGNETRPRNVALLACIKY